MKNIGASVGVVPTQGKKQTEEADGRDIEANKKAAISLLNIIKIK